MKKKRLQSLVCFGVVLAVLQFSACDIGNNENWAENILESLTMLESPLERDAEDMARGESVLQRENKSSLEWRLQKIESKQRMTENLGTAYEKIIPFTSDSMTCIAKKEGKWGIVTVTGEVLVDFMFTRLSYRDATGWIELEKNGYYFVYDETGRPHKQYRNKLNYRMESKEGYLYRSAVVYAGGMRIKSIVPEVADSDYYGVQYFNATTEELLYEAIGTYDDVGMFTLPDKTGRAVAIQNHGTESTVYYITADGCTSRTVEPEEGVNLRYYDFIGGYDWAEDCFSEGWLRLAVYDSVPGFLMDEKISYTAFFNVDTFELVRFPKQYQKEFWMQRDGKGTAMAIMAYNEDANAYRYAVCMGDRVLTEEKYYRVAFEDNCMIAYTDDCVEILDYYGNILTRYADAGDSFVNGKLLVYDGIGVFFLDESLKKISDYIVTGDIDGCFSRGIVIDGEYYLLKEFAE
ncbi:MAG: hypothetical protein ACI4FZ_00995 [Lachnospiraceae bacterium]